MCSPVENYIPCFPLRHAPSEAPGVVCRPCRLHQVPMRDGCVEVVEKVMDVGQAR